ncbi:hypothetical protein KKG29_01660 [Patescibacteria group bacterium]|nr:hypothetical protein [Patescibacteria group bacterium]MBU3999867.1 hypothetical protein [Patescibacteria group bacterium]MBU4368721.1 hypothetical protein [Patescibacteria group bacterium]
MFPFSSQPKNLKANGVSAQKKNFKSVQRYLDIAEIRDGVVILKNGGLRAAMMVSSINFALKSQDEQEAIVYHFQNFLNSLDFSVQIAINSRKLNIEDYYSALLLREKEQSNELLKIQIAEYRNFIKGLVEMSNIVSKNFYAIVPYSAAEDFAQLSKGFLGGLAGKGSTEQKFTFKEEEFDKNKGQLWQRVEHVANGLAGIGIRTTPLNTQELIELFYMLYNPDISERGGLAAMEELDIAK